MPGWWKPRSGMVRRWRPGGYTSFSEEDGTVMETPGTRRNPDLTCAKKSCFSGESVWLRMDVVVWNKVYRRSFFEENGLRMKPGFRGGEDDIFWLTALPHASRLAVIPDQLYFYRRKRAGPFPTFGTGTDGFTP